ncbi:MAG: ATP-binding protein, partial [Schaedlerella arabinosiphila]|nr:ATP-binding protein [Schaedlerella arabinosiphila]
PYEECPANGLSSKPGHEGLGLQNVRQALEKYQGEMEIRKEEGIFSVTLLFAVQEE